jgi:hypothetical protein
MNSQKFAFIRFSEARCAKQRSRGSLQMRCDPICLRRTDVGCRKNLFYQTKDHSFGECGRSLLGLTLCSLLSRAP